MSEVINAEATPIESELSALSGAERWLSKTRDMVSGELSQYDAYPVTDGETHKQAKRERAHLNGVARDVDTERKSMTKALTEAVKAFKADTDAAIGPITELVARYDVEIKAYESKVVAQRIGYLQQQYMDAAPDIAIPQDGQRSPLVPFDLVMSKFGNGELGKKWTNFGTSDVDAEAQLYKALERIAADEEAISGMVQPEDAEAVKAAYFSTLDMQSAVAEANRVKLQRERVARLEAERMIREESRRDDPPLSSPEPQSFAPSQPMPQTMPMPMPSAPSRPQREQQDGSVWVFAGYGTLEQANAFAYWCETNGVTRHVEVDTHGREYKLTAR